MLSLIHILSVNNLNTLDVNYGEKDYIVNVSRETSEDENVETSDDETENEDTCLLYTSRCV